MVIARNQENSSKSKIMKLDEEDVEGQAKPKKIEDQRSLTIPQYKTNRKIPFMEP
jgi:hypothetical protein